MESPTTGILVKNAGLVLLNSYYPMLFERLGVVKDYVFIDAASCEKAVYTLQVLATGQASIEDGSLALNNILCGIAPATLHTGTAGMLPEHKSIIESLLRAAMYNWPDLGDGSPEYFRENWLIRNAMLIENEKGWELTIEKRVYDILMLRAPYSFSEIKYPWMKKTLHVNWKF